MKFRLRVIAPRQSARHLFAHPWRRLGSGRRRHAGSDAGTNRRQHRSGRGERGVSSRAGASLSRRSGRLRDRGRVAGAKWQEGVRHRCVDHRRRVGGRPSVGGDHPADARPLRLHRISRRQSGLRRLRYEPDAESTAVRRIRGWCCGRSIFSSSPMRFCRRSRIGACRISRRSTPI